MILMWGVPGDPPLDAVGEALGRCGATAQLLDQRWAAATEVALRLSPDGRVGGEIVAPDGVLPLNRISAFYLRPMETTRACGVAEQDEATFARAAATDAAIITWADLGDAAMVNRPEAMAANNAKPYHALIAACGFAVPHTLVTTDPAAVRRFHRRHGSVIYKSVSGVRSIVARLADADDALLHDVANCPTQFQAFVPGTDMRVHVVGDAVLATEIRSDAEDYRYASRSGVDVTMAPAVLPDRLAEACIAMVRSMRLLVAGIDLRRTPNGEWYCFEVNPSPGFTYFEAATGQPIATAIADLLLRADRRAAMTEAVSERAGG